MSKLAIAVVLLPPEEVMDMAIEVNKKLVGDPISLNKVDCLPHVTLCIGAIEDDDLDSAKKIIKEICGGQENIEVTINKISSEECCFELQKTGALQSLHESIMNGMLPFLSYEVTTDMCYSPPFVESKTTFWISNYERKFSFENYYPHITLGLSGLEDEEMSVSFVAPRLAICHLGNYCTCRKILYDCDLLEDV